MRFPLTLYSSLAVSFFKHALKGNKKFPFVLMLEPTHKCNLSCSGCDRIRLYNEKQTDDLTLSECLEAARESKAPVVTVTGGEPLLYQNLKPLVTELLRIKRFIYLCTNGLITESFIDEYTAHPRLTLNFHIDGPKVVHDSITKKEGSFDKAVDSIKKAKMKGFRVCTNTSVFKNTGKRDLESLFQLLKDIGVDGFLISPAFDYESVDNKVFLNMAEIQEKFREMAGFFEEFPFMSSPLYLDFLKGKRQMNCTPWGNPTRNPLGWKSPCYLITDTYYQSYKELMENTHWERYEKRTDQRCKNCMVHCGYEATVMRTALSRPNELFRLFIWNLKRT
jgi:hopanoid biosynthesis associated radical SAM protein HpnH